MDKHEEFKRAYADYPSQDNEGYVPDRGGFKAGFGAAWNLLMPKIKAAQDEIQEMREGRWERGTLWNTYQATLAKLAAYRAVLEACIDYTGIDRNGFSMTVKAPMGDRMRLIHAVCMGALEPTRQSYPPDVIEAGYYSQLGNGPLEKVVTYRKPEPASQSCGACDMMGGSKCALHEYVPSQLLPTSDEARVVSKAIEMGMLDPPTQSSDDSLRTEVDGVIKQWAAFRQEVRQILHENGVRSNPGWTEENIIFALRELIGRFTSKESKA